MDEAALQSLLADVQRGTVTPEDAAARLRRLPFADLGFARVDHHRALRQRVPEAVYARGKTPSQCTGLVSELRSFGSPVVLTRASEAQVDAVLAAHPDGCTTVHAPGWATVTWDPLEARPGRVLVVTAGTADLPAATECTAVLEALGYRPHLTADCGVAGVHRLLATVDELDGADAVVVVAGMEGALASVVGGITAAPVIAVPTSAGYGAALEGVTALLAMLSSCAAGVCVVGIDNGFGAACAVARVLS
jgi:pyridinium-3,5-biscarboxylic acid mononucleotide synthase